MNLYPYQGGVGCALPFAPVYSLEERWPVFNQMAQAVGVNSEVGGVLLTNIVSIGDSYDQQIPSSKQGALPSENKRFEWWET